MYVIVNGKPTKGGVLWRNLVNVDSVKRALATLKPIYWLYTDVADDCVDEAVQKVIEVSNNATTAVLEKASETDIAAFQQYTIRNQDTKLVCGSDLEQHKMLSVTEEPLDDRMKHLDVMCFPGLFPMGNLASSILRIPNSRTPSTSNRDFSTRSPVSGKMLSKYFTCSHKRKNARSVQVCSTCSSVRSSDPGLSARCWTR